MTDDISLQEHDEKASIEIAFVNAPFSGQPEPSPIAGMDMATFRNYVTRALDGDDGVPESILTVVRRGSTEASDDKKKDQEWWEHFFWLQATYEQLRRIDDLIRHYDEMARQHHELAEQARQRMSEAADKLRAIDEFVTAANDLLSDKERTGKLDREKTIELLNMRGVTAKPDADDATLLILLKTQKTAALGERQSWSAQYEQSNADATRYERLEQEDRAKAEELIKRRDEIRSHGYDPQEETIRLKQVADEYEINVQHEAMKIGQRSSPSNTPDDLDGDVADRFRSGQVGQSQSQADDFETMAGALSKEFATAAANINHEPRPTPPSEPGEGQKVKLGSPV